MSKKFITGLATAMALLAGCSDADNKVLTTDEIGVAVSAEENREYSYTDKKAGYWYGTTHQESPEWWSGWNMAKKRILADYSLGVDGTALDRKEAQVTVYPERLERKWKGTQETFCLVDNHPIIYIGVKTDADAISCSLDMGHIKEVVSADDGLFFTPNEAQDKRIMLTTASEADFTASETGISADTKCYMYVGFWFEVFF